MSTTFQQWGEIIMDLTKEQLNQIANNLVITDHAIDRILTRGSENKLENIENKIRNSQIAWMAKNGDYKIQIGSKLLLILTRDKGNFVGVTTYYCGGRKSHGAKKKASKTIKEHYDRDKKIWAQYRTKQLLKNL